MAWLKDFSLNGEIRTGRLPAGGPVLCEIYGMPFVAIWDNSYMLAGEAQMCGPIPCAREPQTKVWYLGLSSNEKYKNSALLRADGQCALIQLIFNSHSTINGISETLEKIQRHCAMPRRPVFSEISLFLEARLI